MYSAGATGLNAAVQSQVVTLSWRYLPTVLASSLIMLGWALIINNLGRRRYPLHWGGTWNNIRAHTRRQRSGTRKGRMVFESAGQGTWRKKES